MTDAGAADPVLLNRSRSRYEQARVVLAAVAAVAALAALLVSLLLLARLTEIGQTNRANGQVVRDCVDPDGKCYQDGQRRTGQAVASIADAQIAAVACGQEPAARSAAEVAARNAAIKKCVTDVLSRTPPR